MKNKLLVLIGVVFSFYSIQAQEELDPCIQQSKDAYQYLKSSETTEADIEKGEALLIQLANEGCEFSQLLLGDAYRIPKYVQQDPQKAFYYTQMAANQGNLEAQIKLSRMCEEGVYCVTSEQEKIELHRKRFDTYDCEEVTTRLYTLMKGSKRVVQDVNTASVLLNEYANQGCLAAQIRLGKEYGRGEFLPVNSQKSTDYLKMAKSQGSTEAISLLSKLCGSSLGCDLTTEERLGLYEDKLNLLPCEKKAEKAFDFVSGHSMVLLDVEKGLRLLNQYANEGCMDAHYYLGMVYKKGYAHSSIEPEPAKAFEHLNKAVELGHIRATAHLGQLYERGFGCKLNYNKAVDYYHLNMSLGDDMGAYCMGYSYMKGLGSVEQDYELAIEWFEKSEYAMAKHWLAVLHYFGFGTPKNQDLAIEILVNNDKIRRSPLLLDHFMAHKEDTKTILGDFEAIDIEKQTAEINDILDSEETEYEDYEVFSQDLSSESLKGSWEGKLVELDWSGEEILRSFPVSMDLRKDEFTDGVQYDFTVAGQQNSGLGILIDHSLYFDNANIAIPSIFRQAVDLENLHLKLLSADLEIKTLNHIQYLTAYVESNINDWNEPGQPMLLVLANTSVLTDNGVAISDELIQALLNEQGDNFISLYPNPFKTDLLIQYELVEDAYTSVEMYSLDGTFYKKIVDQQMQTAGDKLFYFDGTALQKDVYFVVRVTTGNKAYTKLIIKQ